MLTPKHITRWLITPALVYLVLVFASGTWLRWQWVDQEWMVFNPGYLTHAHSHIAVLGWAFAMLSGLLMRYVIHLENVPVRWFRVLMTALHISVAGMLITFTWQGYGGWSIGFSTLHMLVGYGVAVFYFKYEREDLPPVLRNFYSAAIWWLIISTLGPWLLAFGPAMPPFWMDAGIQFYLHTQFNGWLTFGVLGLALHYAHRRGFPMPHLAHWGFGMLLVGTLPALIPMLDQQQISDSVMWIGIIGSMLYAGGGLLIAFILIPVVQKYRRDIWWVLAVVAGLSFIIKQVLLVTAAIPGFVSGLMDYNFVVVGYLHLLLLGFISTALLCGWLRYAGIERGIQLKLGLIGYLLGAGATLVLLLYFGAAQVFGFAAGLPVQPVLFGAGVVALAGAVLLVTRIKVDK